jgi:hypothetical protein
VQVAAADGADKRVGPQKHAVAAHPETCMEKVRLAERLLKRQQQQLVKLQETVAKMVEDNEAIAALLQEALQR